MKHWPAILVIEGHAGYVRLKNRSRIVGIWDDHDYGQHDGDFSNPDKEFFKKHYLDFIEEPADSPRRDRPDGGIYTSYYLDTGNRVKLILLDIRFNRSEEDDLGKTLLYLGLVQRDWLEREIMGEQVSDIFLLVTASPFIANDRPAGDSVRPKTRNFILEMINRRQKFFLILSGEVHFGEINQLAFKSRPGDKTDLFEVVSSGLSHTTSANQAINDVVLDTFNVAIDYPKNASMRFLSKNFAVLDFDLEANRIKCQFYNERGIPSELSWIFETSVITK